MRNRLAIPAFAFLCLLGTEALAQNCGEVCTEEFWTTSTEEEIEDAIRSFDVSARTSRGDTPLHWAAQSGGRENILLLLEAGADVNTRNLHGGTALHWALRSPENIEVLIEAGAELNATSADGKTPLHWTAFFGTPETVTILLEAGADGTVEDADGNTPFDFAEENEALKGTDAYWALNDARFK